MKSIWINEREDMDAIIDSCEYCIVSMADQNTPYGIPMTFLYEEGTLYLHSGPGGKKEEILAKNKKVSVSFTDPNTQLVYRDAHIGCSYGLKCRSVIARGEVEFLGNIEEKRVILDKYMAKYTKQAVKYSLPALKNLILWKIKLIDTQGKAMGLDPRTLK